VEKAQFLTLLSGIFAHFAKKTGLKTVKKFAKNAKKKGKKTAVLTRCKKV